MFTDKYGFYYLKETGFNNYDLDIGASINLELKKREYIIFHKRRFFKKNTNELQKNMAIVSQTNNITFNFDEKFFKYGLSYYQRNGKSAFIKGGDIEELNIFDNLYKNFDLELKLRKYLEIRGEYENIEQIQQEIKYANLEQAISFLLALATIYGDWNIVEENDKYYLNNILIKFPFDSALAEYQDIILQIEDIFIQNKLYNKLTYTKKQDFIWNIYDFDLLKILGKAILHDKLKDFFEIDESLTPLFYKKLPSLKKQLNTDLRINLESFKLVEIEGIRQKI